jgi:2-polyprenyl-3-methyl-5-hydroxy-6-metoxy-1,4-benzoquinol methylase
VFDLDREAYPYLEDVNEGILRQFAPAGDSPERVLDVGCGQATLAGEIRNLGHVVWGIEASSIAVAKAASRVDRCIQADLLDFKAIETVLAEERFDAIVFSDVLEHLYDPVNALRFYRRFLAPGGRVLISVPNALNWQTRLSFLLGRFEYQDTGVLDRTHVRFFTFRSAARLLQAAGCSIEKTDFTPLLVRALLPAIKRLLVPRGSGAGPERTRAILDSPSFRFYLRWVYPVEYRLASVRKPLFAFRIVLVARMSPGSSEGRRTISGNHQARPVSSSING